MLLLKATRFLILACDGVWDEVDDDDAVSIVGRRLLNDQQSSVGDAADALRDEAFSQGSDDNISVIIACPCIND